MNHHIKCFRFDSYFETKNETKTLTSLTFYKREQLISEYQCIATNGEEVFDGITVFKFEDFFTLINENRGKFLVTTTKEKNLLLDISYHFNIVIICLEEKFPIFERIRYSPNIQNTYRKLKDKIDYLAKIGIKNDGLGAYVNTNNRNILKRKCKYKTNFDFYFAHTSQEPHREVFKFKEQRNDRVVLALDFNSMYPACMSGEFIDPLKLEHIAFDLNHLGGELPRGLFNVKFSLPNNERFNEIHPFKYVDKGRRFPFSLNKGDTIETLAFDFEINAYSKYFDHVYIKSGFVSKDSMSHPLLQKTKRLYTLRKKAAKNKKLVLERLYKYQLSMLHSLTNPKTYKSRKFKSFDDALLFIKEYYLLNPNVTFAELKSLAKYVKVTNEEDFVKVTYYNLRAPTSIHSYHAQVIAKSRVLMVDAMMSFKKFKNLEICYTNSDSIHISIKKIDKNKFLESYSHLIGEEMGKLRVQHESESGVWFDVGRYFLFSSEKLEQHKSILLNTKAQNQPFCSSRTFRSLVTQNTTRFLLQKKVSFKSLLSNKKRLHHSSSNCLSVNYQRYNIAEIKHVIEKSLEHQLEKKKATKFKTDTYQYLKKLLL